MNCTKYNTKATAVSNWRHPIVKGNEINRCSLFFNCSNVIAELMNYFRHRGHGSVPPFRTGRRSTQNVHDHTSFQFEIKAWFRGYQGKISQHFFKPSSHRVKKVHTTRHINFGWLFSGEQFHTAGIHLHWPRRRGYLHRNLPGSRKTNG